MSDIYYKLVQNIGGRLLSLSSADLRSYSHGDAIHDFVLEYRLGEFVLPKVSVSKLFVFDSRENARGFLLTFPAYQINGEMFECEAVGVVKPTNYKYVGYDRMKKFWSGGMRACNEDCVRGTLWADAVKLTREIKL